MSQNGNYQYNPYANTGTQAQPVGKFLPGTCVAMETRDVIYYGVVARYNVPQGFRCDDGGYVFKGGAGKLSQGAWEGLDSLSRLMTLEEIQDYLPHKAKVRCTEHYGQGLTELPAVAVEDRIGLRKEEIDWAAHKEFLRGL
jgi:hypothetical protein